MIDDSNVICINLLNACIHSIPACYIPREMLTSTTVRVFVAIRSSATNALSETESALMGV